MVGTSRQLPARDVRFFRALCMRYRRLEHELSQEDVIAHSLSVVTLCVCDAFGISLGQLVAGLSGISESAKE
jgi:hypothetical protein